MDKILLYKLFVGSIGLIINFYIIKVGMRHRRLGQKNLEIFHYVLFAIVSAFFLFVLSIPMPPQPEIAQ